MATLKGSDFVERYNNGSTGFFKAGQDRGIGSEDHRDLVTTIHDSFLNGVDEIILKVPCTGTNSYEFAGQITAYSDGLTVIGQFANPSTAAATLNGNSIAAKKLYKNPTTQVGDGDIPANAICVCVYDAALDSAAGGFLIVAGLNSIDGGTL
jgi:hypothetical protein